MIRIANNTSEAEATCAEVAGALGRHSEWFYAERGINSKQENLSALRRGEWAIEVMHSSSSGGRIFFSCLTNAGSRVWRVVGWEREGEKLRLEVVRRSGAISAVLELVPRALFATSIGAIMAARQSACAVLAKAACEQLLGGAAHIKECGVSPGATPRQPGRYGRVLLLHRNKLIAVSAPLVDVAASEAETFLAGALLWFARLSERRSKIRVEQLWLVGTASLAASLDERRGLLRRSWREQIKVYETTHDDECATLIGLREVESAGQTKSVRGFYQPRSLPQSELTNRVVDLAPEAIDVIAARHGSTLRFHGLPFARVRRVVDDEKLWFGVDGTRGRTLLDERSWPEMLKLLVELRENRHDGATNHRHRLYTAAPEAWLESILRRNITRLDPGLIISPLHAQFQTTSATTRSSSGARPVDLLAFRQDGRLVVIELKVHEDQTLPLQGAHYWERVERHRQQGSISAAKLFGNKRISDQPPLVYLVAPLLRFARTFEQLAGMIDPQIELYRFDINEDWRNGVRVMRRTRAN